MRAPDPERRRRTRQVWYVVLGAFGFAAVTTLLALLLSQPV